MKDNRKIRVAQIVGHAANGGVESLVFNFTKNMDHDKFDFIYFIDSDTSKIINKETVKDFGGEIVIIPPIKKIFKYNKVLLNAFKKRNIDIVHCNINTLNLFPLRIAKKAGVPVRISHSLATSNPKEFLRHIAKWFLRLFSHRYATHFLACSKEAAIYQFGKKYYETGKVKIVYNVVDFNRFKFNENDRQFIRQSLGLTDSDFLFGNVGRLVQTKNQLFLLKSMKDVVKKNSYSKLLILGDGKDRKKLLQYINKHNLQKTVILLPAVSDVQKYYSAMDCFLMPSLFEGFGLAPLEAKANGLPLLLSDKIPNVFDPFEDVTYLPLKKSIWNSEMIINISASKPIKERKIQPIYEYTVESLANFLNKYYLSNPNA